MTKLERWIDGCMCICRETDKDEAKKEKKKKNKNRYKGMDGGEGCNTIFF